MLSVSFSRELVPAFPRILLCTSLGKKNLVRPLLRTEITQMVNRRAWFDPTKLTTEILNLYKVFFFQYFSLYHHYFVTPLAVLIWNLFMYFMYMNFLRKCILFSLGSMCLWKYMLLSSMYIAFINNISCSIPYTPMYILLKRVWQSFKSYI